MRYQNDEIQVAPVAAGRAMKLEEMIIVGYTSRKKSKDATANSSISDYTTVTENQLNISSDIDIP